MKLRGQQTGRHKIPLVGGSIITELSPPPDPRSWCRAHVASWVSRCGGRPERFPMNGKALCLMTQEMFAARVPGQGHKLHIVSIRQSWYIAWWECHQRAKRWFYLTKIYFPPCSQDFRRRLAKALALQELIEKMSGSYD